MRERGVALVAVIVGLVLLGSALCCCSVLMEAPSQGLKIATFNIENFPKHPEQHKGAFQEIKKTGADILGIQEIVSPKAFQHAVSDHLGPTFAFVFSKAPSPQRLGLVYNRTKFRLIRTVEHREMMLYPRARPAFEVVLQDRGGGEVMHFVVLHLKAGGHGVKMRARQWSTLEPLLQKRRAEGVRLVLLGDMNATEPQDRVLLRELATRHNMEWSTRGLGCTSYWQRTKSTCQTSALDHILVSTKAQRVEVGGACARQGCEVRHTCPEYCEEVSDHCPVMVHVGW